MISSSIVFPLLFATLALGTIPSSTFAEQWRGFRGAGNSLSTASSLPKTWSDTSVSWSASLPGTGQSSPVRWDDLIFATSAEGPNKETLWVTCHDLATGKERWKQSIKNSAPEEITGYVSCAAPTPVVDAQQIYVLFESGDLAVYSHSGKRVWIRNLGESFGPFEGNHGQGASPALSDHGLVVLMDHNGESTLASLDKETGDTQWKTKRETSSAWSSPIIHILPSGKEEIVCSAAGTIISYDPQTGTPRWEYDAINGNNVPSATIHQGYLVAGSSRKNNTQTLQINQEQPELLWKATETTSSFGSPLIYQGRVYVVNRAGIVYCYELKSGKLLFDHRLSSSTWASPLGNQDHVWFFGVDGSTVVLRASDSVEVVSKSQLSLEPKDQVYGYAIADNRIIFRLGKKLLCISAKEG